MFTLLYWIAVALLGAALAALAWHWLGPLLLLPAAPALYAVGYRLIGGRDDPLTAWWKRVAPGGP